MLDLTVTDHHTGGSQLTGWTPISKQQLSESHHFIPAFLLIHFLESLHLHSCAGFFFIFLNFLISSSLWYSQGRREKKPPKLCGPERHFPIRPFLFDNLLFDGATRSPLCARAVPFSKQLPANDTQMAKEFVAAALLRSVSPSELFAPRHSRKTIRTSLCGGRERRDSGLIRSSHRSLPREAMKALCDAAVKTLACCWTNKTRLLGCMCAHTITGTDCFINSSPGFSPIIINNGSILSESIRIFLAVIKKKNQQFCFFFGGGDDLTTSLHHKHVVKCCKK